jgi:hypothetical protein
MLLGVRVFIGVVFGILGLSFLAVTAALIYEYQVVEWFPIATFYSHLFIFFPIFGMVALCAFYFPAVVFLDMYWRHIPGGKVRFLIGAAVVCALSWFIAHTMLLGTQRSLFEVPVPRLQADVGEPPNCNGATEPCIRLPGLTGLKNVRRMSQRRIGLNDLVRNCSPDPLIEPMPERQPKRYCFVSTAATASPILTTDAECCQAQRAYMAMTNEDSAQTRSLTGYVQGWTLGLKVFFLLTLVAISAMLAFRRGRLEAHYHEHMGRIEKGVLIGAVAMLFFPVMNHAFLQSAAMLDVAGGSNNYRGPAPFISFIFGAWALTLLFFFYRRRDKQMEFLGRIGGVIASGIAILKYDAIISYFVRYAGSGASPNDVWALLAIALGLLLLLFMRTSDEFVGARIFGAVAAAKLATDAMTASRPGTGGGGGGAAMTDVSPLPDFEAPDAKK